MEGIELGGPESNHRDKFRPRVNRRDRALSAKPQDQIAIRPER